MVCIYNTWPILDKKIASSYICRPVYRILTCPSRCTECFWGDNQRKEHGKSEKKTWEMRNHEHYGKIWEFKRNCMCLEHQTLCRKTYVKHQTNMQSTASKNHGTIVAKNTKPIMDKSHRKASEKKTHTGDHRTLLQMDGHTWNSDLLI